MPDSVVQAGSGAAPNSRVQRQDALWQAAQDLEASFLAEMLRHAGAGQARGAFGGGAGEAQFASFLHAEQARAMVQSGGGIGLAESLFSALLARSEAEI